MKRLDSFAMSNPDAKNEIINKKGEAIYTRRNKYQAKINGRLDSISAHIKRISEYGRILLY